MTAVLSEDVEELGSQACLPGFNQALGVDYRPACFPVLMTSHDVLRSWKKKSRTEPGMLKKSQAKLVLKASARLCHQGSVEMIS